MISAKKYRQVTRRPSNFLSLTFDFRPATLRKNLVRYFLLRRHVFTYTTTLFSRKRKTYTKKFDFFYFLIRTDGLVLFISLSHLKFSSNRKPPEIVWNRETWGVVLLFLKTKAKFKYCFYQNQFMFYLRYCCLSKQYWSNHIFIR